MRLRLAAALCGASVLLAPPRAAAQSDAFGGPGGLGVPPEAPAAETPPPAPAGEVPAAIGAPAAPSGPVRPILLVGLGGSDAGGVGVSADLGIRIAPWAVRFAYRAVFYDGGYVTSATGRLGWIFAEGSWAAAYVGAGLGRLTYRYDAPGPSAPSVTALSGEVGVHFMQRWFAGPVLALSLEGFAPLARPSDPRSGTMYGPAVAFMVSANPVALLGWRAGLW